MKRTFTKLMAALALLTFLSVPMGMWGQETSTLTFTAACGGSGTADDGAEWTVTSDGTESTYDSNKGIHYGTNSAQVQYIQLSTSDISGTITKVVVNASTASGVTATVGVTVGGSAFGGSAQSLSATATNYTFNGSASGEIVVLITKPSKAAKALYCKSIAVTYTAGSATYTVTYNGNGNTGGNVPVDDTEYDDDNNIVTVLGPGNLTKTGHTFEWWSDMEDGTDEDANLYEEDDTFEITENTTLYAQWSVNTYNYSLSIAGDDNEAMAELKVDGSTVAQGAKIAYDKEVTVEVATNTGYNYSIAVKDANNTDIPVANDKFTMPASDVTVTVTTVLIPTYTITFETGTGASVPQISDLEGSTISLPTTTPSQACVSRGWTFAGWATESVIETTTAPTTLFNNDYTINGDATLYAVYKVTEGDGGSFEYVFSEQGYANAQTVYSATMDAASGIGWAATDGHSGNNTYQPKYYDTGTGLRVYNAGTFTIKPNNKTITNVSLTFADGYTFTSNASNPTIWSGSQSTDITWNVSQTCRLQKVNVTYGSSTTTYKSNPSCVEQVATPTFTPAAGAYTGAQNVTIECDTDGATILYKTTEEGEWQNYSAAIPVSTTTTIWAKATNNGMDDSEVAEATYTIQYILTAAMTNVAEYFVFVGDDTNPIELDANSQTQVRAGATVGVSIAAMNNCYLFGGSLTVNGSADGVTQDDPDDPYFTFVMPEYDVTIDVASSEATPYTLTVVGGENVTFEMLAGYESNPVSLTNGTASICEQSFVTIANLAANSGHVLESVTFTVGGSTTTLTLEDGVYHFTMPSSDATLTFTTTEIPTYSLVTSIDQLVSGKRYIIASGTNYSKAMGKQSTNNRAAVTVQSTNGVIPETSGVYEFVIIGPDVNGNYTIYDVAAGSYLYAAGTGSANNLKLQNPINDRGLWKISFSNQEAVITAITTDTDRKIIRYNNSSTCFSCYGSGQNPIYLYAKDNEATESYTMGITSYETSQEAKGGYYLIASPVGQVTPTEANGFLTNSYDLYAFNESFEGEEWRNYEANSFNLISGRGYLYANNGEDVTITFVGIPYVGNGQVFLSYTEDNTFAGWNLIGNPFATDASIPNSRNYYVLNDSGSELIAGETHAIGAKEGIFVKASAAGESVTFTQAAKGNSVQNTNLVLNLSNSNGIIDRAIVRFDECQGLEKFQLNPNHTKVFFTQGNKDYAVVRSANEGEMPVNFRASKNGTYTINVNVKNVEMNYLHLFDNKTGADVDLLVNPSYTFQANSSDYESRFRLVFKANADVEENAATETFAYFNGSEWVINTTSNATLQVVDMMGRVLSSEQINGNTAVNLNQAAGIYMLRLVNGENVMVQKVVVK